MPGTRAAGFVAVFAHYRSPDLWLKRDGIVPAAIVAYDLIPGRSVLTHPGFFRAALRAPLRGHHIALVKYLLVFFAEDKVVAALNARDLNVGHNVSSSRFAWVCGYEVILAQPRVNGLIRRRDF
jgi:hypothetical protein